MRFLLVFLILFSCGSSKKAKTKQLEEKMRKLELAIQFMKSENLKTQKNARAESDIIKISSLTGFELSPLDPTQKSTYTDGKDTITTTNAILRTTTKKTKETDNSTNTTSEASDYQASESGSLDLDLDEDSTTKGLDLNVDRTSLSLGGYIWMILLVLALGVGLWLHFKKNYWILLYRRLFKKRKR